MEIGQMVHLCNGSEDYDCITIYNIVTKELPLKIQVLGTNLSGQHFRAWDIKQDQNGLYYATSWQME